MTPQQPFSEEGAVKISVEGLIVQKVKNSTHLGVAISSDGTMDCTL